MCRQLMLTKDSQGYYCTQTTACQITGTHNPRNLPIPEAHGVAAIRKAERSGRDASVTQSVAYKWTIVFDPIITLAGISVI